MLGAPATRGGLPRRHPPCPRAAAASGAKGRAATAAAAAAASRPSSSRPLPAPPSALSTRARDAVDLLLRSPPPQRVSLDQVSALLEVLDGDDGKGGDAAAAAPSPPSAALEELFAAARQSRDGGGSSPAPPAPPAPAALLLPGSRLCTFSPKAFLPVTRLCSDECGYCAFASHAGPARNRRSFMTLGEVLDAAAAAASAGATEALFTLGDRPESRWPEAAAELRLLSELHGAEFASTPEYVAFLCSQLLKSKGSLLLPHANAGVTTPGETRLLRRATVSQGLMLETTASGAAPRLREAHDPARSPSKAPGVRLAWLRDAGAARVPTTTGLLVGIGETRRERLETLLALRDCHCGGGGGSGSGSAGGDGEGPGGGGGGGGHLQEIIVQPFQPKRGTRMGDRGRPPPAASELLWTVAVARLLMGPRVGIQSPPNLSPVLPWLSAKRAPSAAAAAAATGGASPPPSSSPSLLSLASPSSSFAREERDATASWRALLRAGADDFGGVSPLTPDYVSPEAKWPHLDLLSEAAALEGMILAPRLAVYPRFLSGEWLSDGKSSALESAKSSPSPSSALAAPTLASSPLGAARRLSDASGLSKGGSWRPGGGSGGGWLPPLRGGRESRLVVASGEEDDDEEEKESEGSGGVVLPLSPSSESPPSSSSASSSSASLLSSLLPSPAPRHAPRWGVEVSHRGTLLLGGGGGGGARKSRRREEEEEEGEEESTATTAASVSAPSPALLELLDSVLESYREDAKEKERKGGKGGKGGKKKPRRYLSETEAAILFAARGADFDAVVAAADELRYLLVGDEVTFVVNRNINYTNVCSLSCSFCAFSASAASSSADAAAGGGAAGTATEGEDQEDRKGDGAGRAAGAGARFRRIGAELHPSPAGASAERPYLLSLDEVSSAAADAWERGGATEVCMQGGISPAFDGATYPALVAAARRGAPGVHVHAFSPLEVTHGAREAGATVREYLRGLKAAGLGSLPGTAAENLRPGPRRRLCPEKLSGREWLAVMGAAHEEGLGATATIMFGGAESPADWARHLRAVRALQLRAIAREERGERERGGGSGGERGGAPPAPRAYRGVFTEFVPLPFVPDRSPGAAAGVLRAGPTRREAVLMHSVARLFFGGAIPNIQASWPKLGVAAVPFLLNAGCNDAGGVLMRESITRAAGGQHGQGVDAAAMRLLVSKANDGRFITRNSTSSTRKWRGDGGGGKRVAVQRTTLYGRASAERVAAADRAAAEKREVGGGGAEAKRAVTAEAAAVSASSPRAA